MTLDPNTLRLSQLPTGVRSVLSLFVVVAGAGYLVALLNLHFTYSLVDGKPGVTPEDLKRSFYGKRDQTILAKKIHGGSMEQYLKQPLDKGKILSWIQDGVPETRFVADVQPILRRDCVRCHSPQGAASFRPLVTLAQVRETTTMDLGEAPQTWARVAHTHLQSLALIYVVLGVMFQFTRLPARAKIVIGCMPFLALVADFGSRALARFWPDMVYAEMLSGLLLGLSTMAMSLVTLYDMWLVRTKPRPSASLPLRSSAGTEQ